MTITLARGDWLCEVEPELGGAIARLAWRGIDLLRPAPAARTSILEMASFPLVPFANRIGHGRMAFDGTDYQLDPDPIGAPHALHGHGWRAPWTVIEQDEADLAIAYHHDGSAGWPWQYHVRQLFYCYAEPARFEVEFDVRSPGDRGAMPLGMGLHPYFARDPASAVRLTAPAMWAAAPDGLATTCLLSTTFASGGWVPVAALEGLDNFFPTNGPAQVRIGGVVLEIHSDAIAGFHLYVPPGANFFCVEPVSHAPDAFGRGEFRDDEDVLPPGTGVTANWYLTPAAD